MAAAAATRELTEGLLVLVPRGVGSAAGLAAEPAPAAAAPAAAAAAAAAMPTAAGVGLLTVAGLGAVPKPAKLPLTAGEGRQRAKISKQGLRMARCKLGVQQDE